MVEPTRLVIGSDSENVRLVAVAVDRVCSLIPLSALDCYKIEVCVVEAVNNAIEHAYEGREGNHVEVVFTVLDGELRVEICDYGRKMDERYKPSLDFDPDDLANLPEGGMGLYIISSLMDEFSYSTAQGRNILRMRKLLSMERGLISLSHPIL